MFDAAPALPRQAAAPTRRGVAAMPRSESKDDESKGGEAKDAGPDFERNELLMLVAVDAATHLFGPESELSRFVAANAEDFLDAADGDATGAGSPIKAMDRWARVHDDYKDILDEILTAIVAKNGGTTELFMRDVRDALDGGEGFLFEDDNYGDFVRAVQALDDYGAFHRLMIDAARKSQGRHK